MGFLKNLFGGGSSPNRGSGGDNKGIYAYIEIIRSGEVVPVRMMVGYDISQDDEGRLFSRKMVMGTQSFDQVECYFYFDSNYNIVNADIGSGGKFSDEAAYLAQQEQALNE